MDEVQTVVVGAGVVGLAIARHLARRGQEVLILEAEAGIGRHTSSRNSGVIHAGIYYPRGSDQQVLCRQGRAMLYDFCESRHVGMARCGKLTVAPDEAGVAGLHALVARGAANGVGDLRVISRDELRALEPEVEAAGAMLSPSSGIVDAVGLMQTLLGEAEAAGAMLALGAPFSAATSDQRGFVVKVADQSNTVLRCQTLINAAGLGAWKVARAINGVRANSIPPRYLAKGSYFSIAAKSPFSALIYPMPEAGSLGVHSVQDLGGGVRFGPNMEWVSEVDYAVDPALRGMFETAIRRYWPGLPEGVLEPDTAGVRPRIWGPGMEKRVFDFQDVRHHGVPGLISLFGFESPGLTSSLAIAARVGAMAGAGY